MTIHQRSTCASAAPSTGGRGCVQATIDIASTLARAAVTCLGYFVDAGAGFVSHPSALKTSSADP